MRNPERFTLLLIAFALACGCARRSTTATTSLDSTSASTTRADSVSAEEHFRRLGVEIDSLTLRVRGADAKLQAGLTAQIERLRTQRDSTAAALDRLRASGREGWERAKVGTDSMLGGLDRAVRAAQAALRGGRDTTMH